MKLKVNIRDLLAENADHETLMLAPVGIEIDELLDFNGIDDEQEIDMDIHELLAENHQIAHIWSVDDVQDVRPDLTDDQAWQVLKRCENRLDCNQGITWDTIRMTADDLYGPKPAHRWHGRIDVTITDTDDYSEGEVLTRLRDMADLLAKDMPDVAAKVDPDAIHFNSEQ